MIPLDFLVIDQKTHESILSASPENLCGVTAFCLMPPFLILGGRGASIALWNLDKKNFDRDFFFSKNIDDAISSMMLFPIDRGIDEMSADDYLYQTLVVTYVSNTLFLWHPLMGDFYKKKFKEKNDSENRGKLMLKEKILYCLIKNNLIQLDFESSFCKRKFEKADTNTPT